MFDTVSAVIATVVFLLPGFLVGDLAQRQRAGSGSLGDQRALLRALFFSVLIHAIASYWTWRLAQRLLAPDWERHYGETLAYVLVVVLVLPIVIGLLLSRLLVRAEQRDGQLRWWHYALGARDARDAWDYAFQKYRDEGVWVLVRFKDAAADAAARVVIGKYGRGAAVGQSPVPEHDLFLRELWLADEAGTPVRPYDPPRSLLVAKSEIAELYLLENAVGEAGREPPGCTA